MEQLKNVTISKAYKGKAGVNKFGPWQAWSVYLLNCEAKFDYFEKGGIVPCDGMVIDVLEYEIKQNGEYTNYDIKRLVPRNTGQAIPSAVPTVNVGSVRGSLGPVGPVGPVASKQEENKRLLMCTSYVKDIMVELIKKGDSLNSLDMLVEAVASGGLKLVEKLTVLPPEKREAEKAKEGTPPPGPPMPLAEPSGVALPALPVISAPASAVVDDISF